MLVETGGNEQVVMRLDARRTNGLRWLCMTCVMEIKLNLYDHREYMQTLCELHQWSGLNLSKQWLNDGEIMTLMELKDRVGFFSG